MASIPENKGLKRDNFNGITHGGASHLTVDLVTEVVRVARGKVASMSDPGTNHSCLVPVNMMTWVEV